MTDQDFQQQVLRSLNGLQEFQGQVTESLSGLQEFQNEAIIEFQKLNGRFDNLEGKVDRLSEEFHDFKDGQEQFNANQEQFNDTIWMLSNQSFQAMNDIRNEVLPPWKSRKPIGTAM